MSFTIIFHWLQTFLAHHAIIAPIIFAVTHIFFAVFLIPCSPMPIIAGALWGKWLGLIISTVSAVLSSCTTFWLSRRFFKKRIYAFLSKRYAKTDWFLEQTKKHSWKFIASIQTNPAAPASTFGYLFGLSSIDFPVYAFFSFVFNLPLQIILVMFGDSVPTLLKSKIGLIFSVVLLAALIFILLKKKAPKSDTL